MKNLKNKLLLLMMLIASQLFSQIATKDSACLDSETLKQINLDLLDYDRLIKNKTEENLNICLELSNEKDSLIQLNQQHFSLKQKELQLSNEQINLLQDQLKFAKKKKGKGWFWLIVGVAVGSTTVSILQ